MDVTFFHFILGAYDFFYMLRLFFLQLCPHFHVGNIGTGLPLVSGLAFVKYPGCKVIWFYGIGSVSHLLYDVVM